MGACESCVNNTKTSRGGENISYDKKKKRASGKLRKQRNESFATGPRFGSESCKYQIAVCDGPLTNYLFSVDETSTTKSSVQKSDFKLLKVIGRGSYGKVYLVQHHMGEQVYAMKVVKKDTVIKSDQVNGIKGKFSPCNYSFAFFFPPVNDAYIFISYSREGNS